MTRHLLSISDLTPAELTDIVGLALTPQPAPVLARQGVALLFEKPSARTRHSTEMAVVRLGGHPIYVRPDEVGIDTRESAEDVARTLACFHTAIAARVFEHSVLERMAESVSTPVINLLSEHAHPLQAIADLLTIRAEFGGFGGLTVTWVGDYSNVARSLAEAAAMEGMGVRFACPDGYAPSATELDSFKALGAPQAVLDADPRAMTEGAHVVVTDAWYSMGQEAEKAERYPIFEPYRVDADLMALADPDAIFLHCLPAHRGDEVTDEVLDGPRSRVWAAAANRLPAAQGALEWAVTAPEAAS